MAKNRLYTHFIVDCSGSMSGCIEATTQGIKDHLKEVAAEKSLKARVGITRFNSTNTSVIVNNMKAKDTRITDLMFGCGGMTPLFDAIGRTVSHIKSLPLKKGTRINLVIVTDGMENASREYNKESIRQLLESLKTTELWNVIYIGADHDAFTQGRSVGVAHGQTMQFDKSKIAETYAGVTRSSMSFGMAKSAVQGVVAAAFTDDERKAAEKD